MRPYRRQPTTLRCPWDSPGKNTGVGCHFLLQCMKVKSESEVAQSCPTLCGPMDCSLPGSSVHGIFQARVLDWVAIAFSEANPKCPEILPCQKERSPHLDKSSELWLLPYYIWNTEMRRFCDWKWPMCLGRTGELLDLSEISANATEKPLTRDSGRKRKLLYDCNLLNLFHSLTCD